METLQQVRLNCGWTQRELARQLGVDPHTLREWEAGRQRPHLRHHRLLAEKLGYTLDQLRQTLRHTAALATQQTPRRRSPVTLV